MLGLFGFWLRAGNIASLKNQNFKIIFGCFFFILYQKKTTKQNKNSYVSP